MKINRYSIIFALVLIAGLSVAFSKNISSDPDILDFTADLKKLDIGFYWKDDSGQILGSIQHLKDFLDHKHKKLVFAMNGGMFKTGNFPVGLFIQPQVTISPLDTSSGNGNFYLKPNGVFYIDGNKATICQTKDFKSGNQITFATQSGPMLLINGIIHPAFKKGSGNINIRNGVGILADGKLVFAMSKTPINFYDFAGYFRKKGCLNALYLDGFVSRTYLPEKNWMQTDGDFGVMIAATIPEQ